MLGDALVYGFSLYMLARSAAWRAGAALLKGLIQAAFGLSVLAEVAYKIVYGGEPLSSWMAGAGGSPSPPMQPACGCSGDTAVMTST